MTEKESLEDYENNEIVQMNARVPKWMRETLNQRKESPSEIVTTLIGDYLNSELSIDEYLKPNNDNSDTVQILKAQLDRKEQQLEQLQTDLSKHLADQDEVSAMYLSNVKETMDELKQKQAEIKALPVNENPEIEELKQEIASLRSEQNKGFIDRLLNR